MMNGTVCDYGTTECACAGGPGGLTWRCHMCPATEPMNGSACTGMNGATCTYGQDDCSCVAGKWSCGTCPAQEPTNGMMCSPVALYCGYGSVSCLCTPGGAVGGQTTWRCNAPCPMQQPAPGMACSTPQNMQCMYGTITCICVGGSFFCN
jgi:hypothetical protein